MTNEQLTGAPAGIERNSQAHADWLMQERVEVIAPWPGMPKWYLQGSVIANEGQLVSVIHIPGDIGSWKTPFAEIVKMPHLFRRLHWWEGRSPAQMPGYIKYVSLTTRKTVFDKVEQWYFFEEGQPPAYDHEFNNLTGDIYLPATQAEWEAFQSQLKGKK